MSTVGILTFYWADDFGAMLQAYALKECITSLGFSTCIIPYAPKKFVGRYWLLPYTSYSGSSCSFFGKTQFRIFKKNVKRFGFFLKKRSNMSHFRNHFLHKSQLITKPQSLLKLSSFDNILIGSDQVWNSGITFGLDKMYWGNFRKSTDGKIISYAASLGCDNLSDFEKAEISKFLNNFDTISVREPSSIPLLQTLTSKFIDDMPDPTLLCSKNVWMNLCAHQKTTISNEKHIIFHSTEYNPQMLSYAKALQNETGCKLIDIREDVPAGPLEFLSAISNAEYVVTNSFHGTVFSILFEKQFVVFSHSNKNSRLKDLMENLGLSERLCEDHLSETIYKPIDWEYINKKLESQKDKGISFLKRNLI